MSYAEWSGGELNIKADSKGRLTGARAGERYVRSTAPDGTITFRPRVPESFDRVRVVSQDQFEGFFGVKPAFVPSAEPIEAQYLHSPTDREGFLPHALVLTVFPEGEDGVADRSAGRERVLIKIRSE